MFIFGHVGITIVIVYLLARFISSRQRGNPSNSLIGHIDFRIVIIAAMLPDIIDKIVGLLIFKEEISNGRLFTHSIVIVGMISICLFIAARKRYGPTLNPLFYASPLWIHLTLDRMWEEPHTLFWPLFGTGFPRLDIEIGDYFTILLSDPYILTSEILGALIIIILVIRYRLFTKTNLLGFLRNGRLGEHSNR